MNVRLYVAQRLTAALMVPLVAVHVALIIYASRHGLTAADVLARTRGNIGWALFYGAFVVAAAIHGPIGMRAILREWSPLPYRSIDAVTIGLGLLLALLGLRAVAAVFLP